MKCDEIEIKTENTNMERYGVKCIFQSKHFKEIIENTMIEKYGTKNYTQSEDYRNRL